MATPGPSLREQGMQALREGNLDGAIDMLARAVMADDHDADSKAMLGIAYSQKGLHDQAKRALQTAVELQPQNPNYKFNLGVALERAGDLQGAAIAYRDTLQLNPEHAQAKAKMQALGPQAHSLLARAPKPHEPVGVPTYNTTPTMATPGTPTLAGLPTMPPSGPSLDPNVGPPGTVKCSNCSQFSQLGMTCEWCSAPLRPPASAPAAPTAYGAPVYGGAPGYGAAPAPQYYGATGPGYLARKPHRGGLILALGILGLLICGFCGIGAWTMGNNDLREMDEGVMDDTGRGLTNAGRILGMITVGLMVLGLLFYAVVFFMAFAGAAGRPR